MTSSTTAPVDMPIVQVVVNVECQWSLATLNGCIQKYMFPPVVILATIILNMCSRKFLVHNYIG